MAENENRDERDVAPATNAQQKSTNQMSEESTRKLLFFLEVTVMTPIVLATIGLFLTPFVLFALPPPPPPDMAGAMNTTGNATMTEIGSGLMPVCSQGFFLDDEDQNGRNATNTCRPACGEFLRKPLALIIFEDLAIIGSIIACVLMFIMAATVQRKQLLVFPSIINLYICISSVIFSGILFIGILDNYGLYCGQRDLLFLLGSGNQTPFTTLTGMAFIYFVLQFDAWGNMYAFFLLWGVKYPFNFRYMKISGKMRYFHITAVILVLLLPLPSPFILLFLDGYMITITSLPSVGAFGRNPDEFFYCFTIAATISLAITAILMEFVCWTVFQEFVLKKLLTKSDVGKVGKAELKISIIIIFYLFFGVMGLASSTYLNASLDFINSIFGYIFCESSGLASNCLEILDVTTNDVVRTLLSIALASLLLWPVVIVISSIEPKLYRDKMKKFKFGSSSNAESSTNNTDSSKSSRVV